MEPLRFPANKVTSRARAFQLIRERSFFRKTITLVSGRETDFYFDMKPTHVSTPKGRPCWPN